MSARRFLFVDTQDSTARRRARAHVARESHHRKPLVVRRRTFPLRFEHKSQQPKARLQRQQPQSPPLSSQHHPSNPPVDEDQLQIASQGRQGSYDGGQFLHRVNSEPIEEVEKSLRKRRNSSPEIIFQDDWVTYLGSGKVDPFQTYPVTTLGSSVDKLIDYSVKYLWPKLRPYGSDGLANPAATRWLVPALSHPALFYGFMYGASAHIQATQGFPDGEESPDVLISRAEAIVQLNEEMRKPGTASSDENILAVLCMAANGITPPKKKAAKLPTQSTLRTLQSLDTYATLTTVPVHAEGLARLVDLRGGLEELKLDGLAETLCFSDILAASRFLMKPRWSFIPHLKEESQWKTGNKPESLTANPSPDHLGEGFEVLLQISTRASMNELLGVLRSMCAYTAAVDDHFRRKAAAQNILAMIDRRNFVQHRLMSLPSADEFLATTSGKSGDNEDGMYEAVRLAAIIYSLIVIFPLTPPSAPFEKLVMRLREALSNPLASADWRRAPQLLLWILTMGGLASMDMPERTSFVVSLKKLCIRLRIWNWEALKRVISSFLWLDSTSKLDGMALWSEVELQQFPR